MPLFGDRRHGIDQHAVDAIFNDYLDIARFNVNVAGSALKRGENHRVDQANHRADRDIARESLGKNALFAFLLVLHYLQRERFGGLLEHALRLLGSLQQVADLRQRGDLEDQFLAQQKRQFIA